MVPVLSYCPATSRFNELFLVASATTILARKYLLSQSKQQPLEICSKIILNYAILSSVKLFRINNNNKV
jgi:hypothetical protein